MFKRAVDISISSLLLLVLWLPLLITAFVVRLTMGSPVLFIQTRPGYRGHPFDPLKFRTMTDAVDERGKTLPDELRLTRTGRFLRRYSLDELPQLWNVLRGDMSLVGPRPLLIEYLPLYSPEQARRHEVRPGVTGWAQVNGRNDQTWEERLRLDVWYVDHRSFWLDLRILWLTLLKVLRSEGVNQPGHATMPRFTGSHGEPSNG
ncbi:MAG TPA: sugar transferase [Burkholderiales bacterium]|nr:sugar transferase [Burkholderiales bacterium]